MLPFLVDTARLFELFVAEWLSEHLPEGLEVRAQEHVAVGEGGAVGFDIDLVLYDVATNCARCLLDTKYKRADAPSPADIAQVVT
ncbi:MAG: McrC family protein [Chloroflexota bacterium]|nr:McrC family protein [Chloroflexota bacterium]